MRGPGFRAQRRAVRALVGLGVLGLLAAGLFFVQMPILKWSGPNAFEAIEKTYVDLERVQSDAEAREQYEFLKAWIMGNEPHLRRMLGVTRAAGIVFSLLVSACAFVLAYSLGRRAGGRTAER